MQRALRWIRAHADQWDLAGGTIGVMGSRAGGHLASTLMTHYNSGDPTHPDPVERHSSRPDFGVLCYAVTSMDPECPWSHKGCIETLLGTSPDRSLYQFLSTHTQVTETTPPCFIWTTREDPLVTVEHAMTFAAALHAKAVPYDLHIYQRGPHGMALTGRGNTLMPPGEIHPWAGQCLFWMKGNGWLAFG